MHDSTTNAPRPAAIEDWSNRHLVHPLAAALLPLARRSGIHPNAVSVAGLACGALAGVCYARWQHPGFVALGFLAMLCWHILDGLDGQLARATGKATPLGRLIDGACDYLVFFFVMIPIALTFPDWGATLALCLTGGAFHAVQAAAYEATRATWTRRAAGGFAATPRPPAAGIVDAGYNWLEAHLAGGTRPIDLALAANPALLPAYLATTAPLVRGMGVLSANNRTMALAAACIAGDPRLYWVWEIAGLTLLGWARARTLRRAETTIMAAVQPLAIQATQ